MPVRPSAARPSASMPGWRTSSPGKHRVPGPAPSALSHRRRPLVTQSDCHPRRRGAHVNIGRGALNIHPGRRWGRCKARRARCDGHPARRRLNVCHGFWQADRNAAWWRRGGKCCGRALHAHAPRWGGNIHLGRGGCHAYPARALGARRRHSPEKEYERKDAKRLPVPQFHGHSSSFCRSSASAI